MKEDKFVTYIREYGSIDLKLKERMDALNLTRNYLARRVDTRFEVIDRWYNNDVEKLDLDILARICFVLECDVSDLIEYVK